MWQGHDPGLQMTQTHFLQCFPHMVSSNCRNCRILTKKWKNSEFIQYSNNTTTMETHLSILAKPEVDRRTFYPLYFSIFGTNFVSDHQIQADISSRDVTWAISNLIWIIFWEKWPFADVQSWVQSRASLSMFWFGLTNRNPLLASFVRVSQHPHIIFHELRLPGN